MRCGCLFVVVLRAQYLQQVDLALSFLDETSVKPDIQKSTLDEDVDVDYRKAAENAAVEGLISGVAGYVYAGVKQAAQYLKNQGVPRLYRKKVLESFDIDTVKLEIAGKDTYGLRFYGGNAALQIVYGPQYVGGALQWYINSLEDLIKCQ